MRFAVFGTGFWARFQIAAWQEVPGATCVALYNRTRAKAEILGREFNIPKVYDDPEQLLDAEQLDFVDVITDVYTHSRFVQLAAHYRLPVICQKPMAPSLEQAAEMVVACRGAGVPLLIHENWRWQGPLRQVARLMQENAIGRVFRARLDMISGFPTFVNQPFLKELEQFILTDLGTHILDVARFFFGEASSVYCQNHRIHPDIRGEDVATVMMKMGNRSATVLCQMAYAENPLEHECFPQTLLFIEGDRGSIEVAPDYWVRITTERGTHARRYPPKLYSWVDPAYAVVQSSIVDCNRHLLQALQGRTTAETTGEDNLRTLELVYRSYDSAKQNQVLQLTPSSRTDSPS